jgi:membrane-associated protease RseP (regulator of RpoE activity)
MPKNKRVLLDIGIGGPLSGLVVAIPILFYGLMTSTLNRLPLGGESGVGVSLEGNSLFYLFAKWLVFGKLLTQPIVYDTLPLFYWIRYFFTGLPVPWGAVDVHLNAVAWAGWAGLLVTALNLIPVGQLDGGHLLYVLFGNKARQAFPFILASLFYFGFCVVRLVDLGCIDLVLWQDLRRTIGSYNSFGFATKNTSCFGLNYIFLDLYSYTISYYHELSVLI